LESSQVMPELRVETSRRCKRG